MVSAAGVVLLGSDSSRVRFIYRIDTVACSG